MIIRLNMESANSLVGNNPDFVHEYMKDNIASLCRKVDECVGGWPADAHQLMFYHSVKHDGRYMRFTSKVPNNEYWTRVLTARQYHMHKAGFPDEEAFDYAVSQIIKDAHNVLRHTVTLTASVSKAGA